jgi:hypothetical protein
VTNQLQLINIILYYLKVSQDKNFMDVKVGAIKRYKNSEVCEIDVPKNFN